MPRLADLTLVPAPRLDPGTSRVELTSNVRRIGFGVAVLACLATVVSSAWVAGAAGALVGLVVAAVAARPAQRMRVGLTGPAEVELGQRATFVLGLQNDAVRPSVRSTLLVELEGLTPMLVEVNALPPGGRAVVNLSLQASRRTRSRLSLTLRSSDPLGLLDRVVCTAAPVPLAVVPVRVPADRLPDLGTGDPRLPAARPGEEVSGVRPWRRGDRRRDVHWRSSARRSELVVLDRPAPPPSPGLALVLAGAAGNVEDELVIAAAAALAAEAAVAGGELVLAGWTATGRVPATTSLFAERDLVLPRITDVLQVVPASLEVVVAAAADVAPAWRHDLAAALAGRGQSVRWLEPATVDPAVAEFIQAGLPTPALPPEPRP